ncbi:MAG: hypothetical protein MJ211_16185 [Bacteroidales bacterium]|nr:hypothetical protein [Bacteroidales bacterium]
MKIDDNERKQLIELVNLIIEKNSKSLHLSDITQPLLWTGIPLIIEILALISIKTKFNIEIASYLFIISFFVQIGYFFFGMIVTIKFVSTSKKKFAESLIDNLETKIEKRKLVQKKIKQIGKTKIQKINVELSTEIENFNSKYSLYYEGISNTSLFSLVILFFNSCKEFYNIINQKSELQIISFIVILIPLFTSLWISVEKNKIYKYKEILSYIK